MDAGISFSPAQQPIAGQPTGMRPGTTPLQDAIKLLSFKLPTNVGAGAPSPTQLMGGPSPFGAQLGNGVANNWLMALFQGLNPAASGAAGLTGGQNLGGADLSGARTAVQYQGPPQNVGTPGMSNLTLPPPTGGPSWNPTPPQVTPDQSRPGGAQRTIGPAAFTPSNFGQ